MKKANEDIRETAKKCNVPQWKIAERLGYSEEYFCRKLRKELPEDLKLKVYAIIGEISSERGA